MKSMRDESHLAGAIAHAPCGLKHASRPSRGPKADTSPDEDKEEKGFRSLCVSPVLIRLTGTPEADMSGMEGSPRRKIEATHLTECQKLKQPKDYPDAGPCQS